MVDIIYTDLHCLHIGHTHTQISFVTVLE